MYTPVILFYSVTSNLKKRVFGFTSPGMRKNLDIIRPVIYNF